jgi:tetratricopeptide (TPR) repeat protein
MRALQADKNLPEANLSLAELLVAKGRYSEALRHLEIGERGGSLSHIALFNLGYSLFKEWEGDEKRGPDLPAARLERIRAYLTQAIEIRPSFVEAYKLLGHVSLINDHRLNETAALLATAVALRPADAELQLMLAKTYLRTEKERDAKAIAQKIATGPADQQIKKEAVEVRDAADEYLRKNLELRVDSQVPAIRSNILFLKRSWLKDADVKQIELERDITNLNSVLDRPRAGEVQIMGSLDKITCSNGQIAYAVTSNGAPLKLWTDRFEGLRLSVLIEGMHSFKLDCGAGFPGRKAVFLYTPPAAGKDSMGKPQLRSVTFVPDKFRLMSRMELAASRTVVVEDDMLRRGREKDSVERFAYSSDAERYDSIRRSMRKKQTAEKQVVARIERIDCSNGGNRVIATAAGKAWQFAAPSLSAVTVNWFGVSGHNFQLACGAESTASVLLTYSTNDTNDTNELKAIEFIPPDLPMPAPLPDASGKRE